jgi:hypothetical protein
MSLPAFDPFRVLTREEREAHVEAYRSFLAERDGAPDAAARTMAIREIRMREIEAAPVAWSGPIDREGFQRAISGVRNEVLDRRTAWILAAARANEGESYGADIEIRRFLERGFQGVEAEDVLVSVMMQESYHCRILHELCRACGLELVSRVPGFATRAFIGLLGVLPAQIRWVPVMAGEIVGTVVFRLLLEHVHLFADEPEVHERMTQLMREIWIDEVLHVAFLRSQIGPIGIRFVRAMVPVVARAALHDVPQLRNLNCTVPQLVADLATGIPIPDEIGWMRDESAESLPAIAAGVVS